MSFERLWAPWRLEYVSGSESADTAPPEPIAWQPGADHKCFLCRAAATYNAENDAERLLLVAGRGSQAIVVLNRYPYNNGHLLVAPLRHVGELSEMTRDENVECIERLAKLTSIYRDRLNAEGFNIGLNLGKVSGAGLPGHLHWHLVPRWAGDNNFMPVLAGTRVIPQSLDALWELLADAFRSQDARIATMTELSETIVNRERAILAPYAMHSADSLGRRHPEAPHPYRGPYQRDRDRVLHSGAFRRLSQKTQVFTGPMGDYHRTRLTHTLEVSSIARTIARALALNEDLVEALALAHDLGHPPFGHSGEDVLNERLINDGGFNHNMQCLRICELLETSYREFPGLNLTREVLDGQRRRSEKHLLRRAAGNAGERADSPLLEVQVVDLADSIAYDAHDADDALELGLLEPDQLLEVPLWCEARQRVENRAPNMQERQLRRAIVHEVIDWQVCDAIEHAASLLAERGIGCVADVRTSPIVIGPSAEVHEKKRLLERFLFDNVYRHPRVLAQRMPAQQALREMFGVLVAAPEKLPLKFRRLAERDGIPRATGDYLAGMTDRFAFEEHRRLIAS